MSNAMYVFVSKILLVNGVIIYWHFFLGVSVFIIIPLSIFCIFVLVYFAVFYMFLCLCFC